MSELCKHLYIKGDFNARTGTNFEFEDFDLSRAEANCYGIDEQTISFINNAHELCTNSIPTVRKSADKTKNSFGKKLLRLCKNNNLYICNGRVNPDVSHVITCIKGSVIDYLIANINSLVRINNFIVHDFCPLLSDVHCALSFSIYIRKFKNQNKIIEVTYKKWESAKRTEFVHNIDRNLVQAISTKLQSLPSGNFSKYDINSIASQVKRLFVNTAKATFKKPAIVSSKTKRTKPWFGLQCRKAQRKYYTARRLNFIQNTSTSRRKMINSCKRYKSTMKKYRNLHLQKLQKNIRNMRTNRPKDYWKLINSIDKKHNESPIAMETLVDFFKTLNINDINIEQQDTHHADHGDQNNEDSTNVLNELITESEVHESIKTLKLNKSSGIDDIVNEYIISTKHIMVPIYVKLFNAILETGNIPSDWLTGIIIPIYKNKGSKLDPGNYRPITLLSCLGKLFTSILNNRLNKFIDENNALLENQSGFRKEYSTIDNIFSLFSLLEYHKSKNKKLYCCFIDFTKAFDNVWRVGLWQKLLKKVYMVKFSTLLKTCMPKLSHVSYLTE